MPSRNFRHELAHADSDFLLAMTQGPAALERFQQNYSQLCRSVKKAAQHGLLDDAALSLASTSFKKMEIFAQYFLDTATVADEISSSLHHSVIQTLSGHDAQAASPPQQVSGSVQPFFRTFPSQNGDVDDAVAPSAYPWLMKNLHNPYPSLREKEEMAQSTGLPVASVDAWFRSVMRDIGWTSLCQTYFAGSLSATVHAARLAFLDDGVGLSADVVFEFNVVKVHAETLYVDLGRDSGACGADVAGVYALDTSPSPPLLDQHATSLDVDNDYLEEEDTTPPPPIAGTKRRATEDAATGSSQHSRLSKRTRLSPAPPSSVTPTPWSPSNSPSFQFIDSCATVTSTFCPAIPALADLQLPATTVDANAGPSAFTSLVSAISAPSTSTEAAQHVPTVLGKRAASESDSESDLGRQAKRAHILHDVDEFPYPSLPVSTLPATPGYRPSSNSDQNHHPAHATFVPLDHTSGYEGADSSPSEVAFVDTVLRTEDVAPGTLLSAIPVTRAPSPAVGDPLSPLSTDLADETGLRSLDDLFQLPPDESIFPPYNDFVTSTEEIDWSSFDELIRSTSLSSGSSSPSLSASSVASPFGDSPSPFGDPPSFDLLLREEGPCAHDGSHIELASSLPLDVGVCDAEQFNLWASVFDNLA
ncbi:hypothetical protein FA95DRAFT_1675197 [Auriscalpium vulgare]|uniref:Uncharacterized protein n=1 Tax=Auriscalpium vulgare TaxID=40419 RepID=A0ACB8S883_9AGAM|nr:hypothetical protein FA95DRAFT_1675197 [Auriscalpium vulgare]